MRQEMMISGAIIATSFVAAVVIAGGPSGIWPSDDAASDAATRSGTTVAPTSVAIDEPVRTTERIDSEQSVASSTAATSTELVDVEPPPANVGSMGPVAPLVDRADLVVAVANGAGIAGIAGESAGRLGALGYAAPAAVNAEPFAYSLVFAASGMTAEGLRLAGDAALSPAVVLPIDEAPPLELQDGTGLDVSDSVDLILMLGTDQGVDDP